MNKKHKNRDATRKKQLHLNDKERKYPIQNDKHTQII